jgi:tRNA-modifying protein YgfZ
MRGDPRSVPLDSLGVLRVRGADSVSFLQGQLSNDVRLLGPDRALLAGYHNPQGRVIALLRLLQLAGDDLLAILPRELVAPVVQRLGKFVLRSKVKLSDESGQWSIGGLIGQANVEQANPGDRVAETVMPETVMPETVNGVARRDGTFVVRIALRPARWLFVRPAASEAAPEPARPRGAGGGAPMQGALWERLAIAAGEPEVYAATSEAFVAQMLNLDALGAIAFDKGCYTGQEIIARAHYRGRVKRRMHRFLSDESDRGDARVQLAPGDHGTLPDGRSFRAVRVARHDDGRCEFLAVTGSETAAGGSRVLSARALEVPYPVPD